MLESHGPPDGVVDLPSAGVSADHGMASLGLVMQLAARTSSALAALAASLVVLEPRLHHRAGWIFIAVALCIARSQLHRIAGRELVYSRRSLDGDTANPFHAMRRYVAFGAVHAIALGLLAAYPLGATPATAAGITAALLFWPSALAIVLASPRFRLLRAGIPLSEDRSLESASVVMTLLGACGAVSTGAIILVLGALPTRHLQHGWGVMLVVVFALLLGRSCLHLAAGATGLGAVSFDRPGEIACRYASFGVVSVFCVGGVLSLLAMSEQRAPEAIVSVIVVCWLLAAWPLTIKRFFSHRQFAELLAGDRILHRRAPDAGLSGLGWLLVGHATLVAAALVLELAVEARGLGRGIDKLLQLTSPVVGQPADLGAAAVVVALELAAAVALLRMSHCRRVISTIYALVAGGVALAAAWPFLRATSHHLDLRLVIRLIPLAIQIVIPAATLILVRRSVMPTARAHYRGSDRERRPDRSR
jgi:hypothetical protein